MTKKLLPGDACRTGACLYHPAPDVRRSITVTLEEYYGDELPRLRRVEELLLRIIGTYPAEGGTEDVQPILYCKSRIKQPDSMICKLQSHQFSTDAHTALQQMHDAVGVRVICSFVDDVYRVADWLRTREEFEVIGVKDYIAYPKPNGYRSLHLILRLWEPGVEGMTAEIQLRTIAIDFWAALEHQMKYKRSVKHDRTIREELKRCADEISSVDLSMQILRDIILHDKWPDMDDA